MGQLNRNYILDWGAVAPPGYTHDWYPPVKFGPQGTGEITIWPSQLKRFPTPDVDWQGWRKTFIASDGEQISPHHQVKVHSIVMTLVSSNDEETKSTG